MFGIYNLKDFLEVLTFIVAIVLGTLEIFDKLKKGK